MNKRRPIDLGRNMRAVAQQMGVSACALLVSVAVSLAIIALMDIGPLTALKSLYMGSFGSKSALNETLVKMTPLLFTDMSYALANRCGLINLGMEGQLYIGALCATVAGICGAGLPAFLHIPLTFLAGFAGGVGLGWIAGYLKAKTGASEIITTVMLNTISIFLINYMVSGPLIEPPGHNMQSAQIAQAARLPRILSGRMHLGFFIALFVVALFWLFVWKSKKGYEIRLSGLNMQAAVYCGVNTKRNTVLVMCLAGGLAGLAGANEIMGIQYRLMAGISPGYGFDGIAVSLIGMNTPLGIVLGAFVFGALRAGGNTMQMIAKVPVSIVDVMQAVVIIMVVASSVLLDMFGEYRLKKEGKNRNLA